MQGQYAVFKGGDPTKQDMVYGDPANAQQGDVWVPFVPVNGDTVVQHYGYDANKNLTYNPPVLPDPSTFPQPDKFRLAIIDAVNAGALPVPLIQYFKHFVDLANDATRRKALYAKFKAASPVWMLPANWTALESAAAAANIPLV